MCLSRSQAERDGISSRCECALLNFDVNTARLLFARGHMVSITELIHITCLRRIFFFFILFFSGGRRAGGLKECSFLLTLCLLKGNIVTSHSDGAGSMNGVRDGATTAGGESHFFFFFSSEVVRGQPV